MHPASTFKVPWNFIGIAFITTVVSLHFENRFHSLTLLNLHPQPDSIIIAKASPMFLKPYAFCSHIIPANYFICSLIFLLPSCASLHLESNLSLLMTSDCVGFLLHAWSMPIPS